MQKKISGRAARRSASKLSANQGVSLLATILVVGAVLTVGMSLALISVREVMMATTIRESMRAFYSAEIGTECAKYWIVQRKQPLVNDTITCDGASIPVTNGTFTVNGAGVPSTIQIASDADSFTIEVFGYNAVGGQVQRYRELEGEVGVASFGNSDVVMIIDTSSSICRNAGCAGNGLSQWQTQVNAIAGFLQLLAGTGGNFIGNMRLGITHFANSIRPEGVFPLSRSMSAVTAPDVYGDGSRVNAGGGTNTGFAFLQAEKMLNARDPDKTPIMIMVTDGLPASKTFLSAAARDADVNGKPGFICSRVSDVFNPGGTRYYGGRGWETSGCPAELIGDVPEQDYRMKLMRESVAETVVAIRSRIPDLKIYTIGVFIPEAPGSCPTYNESLSCREYVEKYLANPADGSNVYAYDVTDFTGLAEALSEVANAIAFNILRFR